MVRFGVLSFAHENAARRCVQGGVAFVAGPAVMSGFSLGECHASRRGRDALMRWCARRWCARFCAFRPGQMHADAIASCIRFQRLPGCAPGVLQSVRVLAAAAVLWNWRMRALHACQILPQNMRRAGTDPVGVVSSHLTH